MANNVITFGRNDIRLWSGGDGNLVVDLKSVNPEAPLPAGVKELFGVEFQHAGNEPIQIGDARNLKLGIRAGTSAHLTPIRTGDNGVLAELLEDHGLKNYLDSHPDQLLLALRLGASAQASAMGLFTYSVLSAKATIDAGGDVGYVYLKPYQQSDTVRQMVADLFGGLKMPSDVSTPLKPGEVISFEYGGYLNLGVALSAGYELQGTQSFDLGQIELSEQYGLSVLGKLGLSAAVAGDFAVQVRGTDRDGWVRLAVRRKRSSQLKIAPDVDVDILSDLKGLPGNGREFLGAALGVNVKNWFNVLDKAREFSDLDALKQNLGSLAMDFLDEYLALAFGPVLAQFKDVLDRISEVVERYNNLENDAITLFDRYFNRLDILTAKLEELNELTSLDQIKGEVDEDLWSILRQLTGGDPLGFLSGRIPAPDGTPVPSLPELRRLAQSALDLIQSQAHEEIRQIIRLAKESFPLDKFLRELAPVDTISELRALAGTKLGHFVERLIGQAIDSLTSNKEVKEVVGRIQDFLEKEKTFENRFNQILKEAAKASISAKLHAEYSRAEEKAALLDVEINLGTDRGRELMQAAGRGDFREVLTNYTPELVRINEGVLSHRLTRKSAFRINVVGWHLNWNYSGFDKVVTETEQRIRTDPSGALMVFTTLEMQKERERKRNGERVYTNFLLRFLGESRGVVQIDRRRLEYLVNIITSMSASYELSFTDEKTEPEELEDYLAFARDFGLDRAGATLEQLRPLLPMVDHKHFGAITAQYQVRYTDAGLSKLFRGGLDSGQVRQTMRKIVLANYLGRGPFLADIAWCYATQQVHDFKQEQDRSAGQRFEQLSSLEAPSPTSLIPGIEAPGVVRLSRNEQIRVVDVLIRIENKLVSAVERLHHLIARGQPIAPAEFEKNLADLGDALKLWDDFDEGENSVFAVFDRMIELAEPVGRTRNCSLTLNSKVGDRTVTKAFVLQSPAPAALTAASGEAA